MKRPVVARGIGLSQAVSTGLVVNWQDAFLDNPSQLSGVVVYHQGSLPLYKAAFIVEAGASAILMGVGGKNYHPLILATEAGIPAIAGIGQLELEGRNVTVVASKGVVYDGQHSIIFPQTRKVHHDTTSNQQPIYVNVGYPKALKAAAESGADGVGLLRIEFTAVRTLASHLHKRSSDGASILSIVQNTNEADAIYTIAEDQGLAPFLKEDFREVLECALCEFGDRDIFVRTLDIAPRENDPMGNRGIRRDVASGGYTITLLGQAIRDAIEGYGGRTSVGVILPLVSHYSQIRFAVQTLLDTGLSLRGEGYCNTSEISFGWEIEQPAASQNNRLWMRAYEQEYKQPPHMIGIGTNDLTQFTIALGRDAASGEIEPRDNSYLASLYDECDFSIVRQIAEVAKQCRERGTRVFLLGQIAAEPVFASLMFALGVIPSVSASRVGAVRDIARSFQEKGPNQAVKQYIQHVVEKYPGTLHEVLRVELKRFFDEHVVAL